MLRGPPPGTAFPPTHPEATAPSAVVTNASGTPGGPASTSATEEVGTDNAPIHDYGPRPVLSLHALNDLSVQEAVNFLLPLFNTDVTRPVIEKIVSERPFRSPAEIMESARRHLAALPRNDLLRVLQDYGRLGSRQRQDNSQKSHEFAGAGLASLTEREYKRFDALNAAYEAKHDFPFVQSVRGIAKHDVFKKFEKRLANTTEVEFDNAVKHLLKVVETRLPKMLAPSSML